VADVPDRRSGALRAPRSRASRGAGLCASCARARGHRVPQVSAGPDIVICSAAQRSCVLGVGVGILTRAVSQRRSLGMSKPKDRKAKSASPKKSPRASGKRRTDEQRQERKSRHQLADCWVDWPLQSAAEDLGEDLLFQIYADGNYTGLSFYVQLKSTTKIDLLAQRKSPKAITYRFDTKDLLHWENSVPPVVLLVWDVEKQHGHWLDVPAALKAVDADKKSWRSKKSVAVKIPRVHTTDTTGREVLRSTLAHLAYPMLASGRSIKITPTFSFPKTGAGKTLAEKLRKTIEEGGTTTIDGKYIKAFRMSSWWERAFGVRYRSP
jgi:Domain of unknown function (DUF4365)